MPSHALGSAGSGCAGEWTWIGTRWGTAVGDGTTTEFGRGFERLRRAIDVMGAPWFRVRLRREGWRVNHKKVERVCREEGLSLRCRARKTATAVPRVALPLPSQPEGCYAMDFVPDRLANGRRFKCFTMNDLCSKEVPVIEANPPLVWNGSVAF